MKLKQPHPFINGVALSSPETHLLHLLQWPTDLGSHDPALCGTTNAPGPTGWVEPTDPSDEDSWEDIYCSACLNRFRLMVQDNDPRLNIEDRQRWNLLSKN